jgi:hypothetical protein
MHKGPTGYPETHGQAGTWGLKQLQGRVKDEASAGPWVCRHAAWAHMVTVLLAGATLMADVSSTRSCRLRQSRQLTTVVHGRSPHCLGITGSKTDSAQHQRNPWPPAAPAGTQPTGARTSGNTPLPHVHNACSSVRIPHALCNTTHSMCAHCPKHELDPDKCHLQCTPTIEAHQPRLCKHTPG